MINQKHLKRLVTCGWQVMNIDENGNVRFSNTHTCGRDSGYEPEYFWVENAHLKGIADDIEKTMR